MRSKRSLVAIIAIWFVSLTASMPQAFGWGRLGHNVSAEIASRYLNESARSQVQALLQNTSIQGSSVWADQIKKSPQWKHTATYHFANVPDGSDYIESVRQMSSEAQQKGDVVMAILKAESILRDKVSDRQSKAAALKFLVHFVADLHQPLHTGRPEDRGGNDISLEWFGKSINLHALWDSELFETAHNAELRGKSDRAQVEWFANYLESRYPEVEKSCDLNVAEWVSRAIDSRAVSYRGYEGDNHGYMEAALPVVENQIVLGGRHLACLLNSALTEEAAPPTIGALLNDLSKVLKKPMDSIIRLEPMGDGKADLEGNGLSIADDIPCD